MIIDILFLMIFLIMGVFGMRKGFIESLTDFLNLVVGISIALFFYVDLSFYISKYISINPTIIIFFSIGLIFAISLIILRLLTSLLLFLFDGTISSYKTLNMILGFIDGNKKEVVVLNIIISVAKWTIWKLRNKIKYENTNFLFNEIKRKFLYELKDNIEITLRKQSDVNPLIDNEFKLLLECCNNH